MKRIIFMFFSIPYFVQSQHIPIVRQFNKINHDGSYNYAFETGNKIFAEEQGYLKNSETLEVQGQYQFTAPEGDIIRLVYTANENGFQPQGSHLPVGPEIPQHVLRTIKWNKEHPEENDLI